MAGILQLSIVEAVKNSRGFVSMGTGGKQLLLNVHELEKIKKLVVQSVVGTLFLLGLMILPLLMRRFLHKQMGGTHLK